MCQNGRIVAFGKVFVRKTIEKIYKQLLIRYLFIDEVDYENIVLSKITLKDLDSMCFDNVYLWIPDALEQIRDLYVKEGVMREKSDEEFESEYADELKSIRESLDYDYMPDNYIDRYEPGDDFEEDWMKQNMKLLKNGKRVFAGKNLFVKGACYKGMELKEENPSYLYLDAEKVGCDILLKTIQGEKEEYFSVAKGGKNWYESAVSMDLLLLDEPELEFLLAPIGGGEKKEVTISLRDLPKRPKKTTRIQMKLAFTDACHGKLSIRDLGFGELFPASDMNYEGELQWEQ